MKKPARGKPGRETPAPEFAPCRQRALRLQALLHSVNPNIYNAPGAETPACQFAADTDPEQICGAMVGLAVEKPADAAGYRPEINLAIGHSCLMGPVVMKPVIHEIAEEPPDVVGNVHLDLLTSLEQEYRNRG